MKTLLARSPFQLVWIALAATAIVVLNEPAAAQPRPAARVDARVAAAIKRGGTAIVRVIVRVAPERRAALKRAWEQEGHRVTRELPVISALTIELPERALDALAREDGVLSVSFDAAVSGHPASDVPTGGRDRRLSPGDLDESDPSSAPRSKDQDLRAPQDSLSFSDF